MTPGDPGRARLLAAARQELSTNLLLEVPFVPVRGGPLGPAGARGPASEGLPASTDEDARRAGRLAALEGLRTRHDATCPHCTTATAHTRTVFGEGDACAALMFIGEAPGEDEDRTGRPFVGRAGQKLDEIIVAMGLRREQVYIANILKSRPPDNRTPLQHEVDGCGPFLAEQIRIIQPKVIVALGSPSAKFLLQTTVGITRLRGQWGTYSDVTGGMSLPVMPTFHPAYLLRNYTPETRRQMWSDMLEVKKRLSD
jgi:DNA polymerase